MATLTATAAIEAAMLYLEALDSGGSALSQQKTDYLPVLQNMIDSWNGDPKMAVSSSRTTFSCVAGTNSYTIGSGQTINVARPSKILAASCLQASGLNTPIRVVQDPMQWSAIVDRGSNSYMLGYLWYDRGNTTGTVYVAPKPLGTPTVELIYPTLITNFTDLTTPIEILPAYARAIKYGLAHAISSTFALGVPQSVTEEYTAALGIIQALNAELLQPSPASPGLGKEVSA